MLRMEAQRTAWNRHKARSALICKATRRGPFFHAQHIFWFYRRVAGAHVFAKRREGAERERHTIRASLANRRGALSCAVSIRVGLGF